MIKALFVLVGGFPSQVIDSQVLIHCKEMKNIGIEFDILSIATNDLQYKYALNRLDEVEELSQCRCTVIRGIKPALPFSEYINSYILKSQLKKEKNDYKIIHARGDYTASIVSYISDNFIWDCRGDRLAEFNTRYKNSKNILAKFYKQYKIKLNIKKAKQSSKAIFVSNFLKNKINYKNDYEIIGCAADENLFYFDTEVRDKMRKKLNISLDKKILIYSGSITFYQMFDECLELFQTFSDDWIFLILTQDMQLVKDKLKVLNNDRYILKSAKFQEVNSYLNMSDVGIMLREENDLNKAASPTKYAEYSMSGLQIIYSDNIGDLDIYDKTIQNRIEINDIENYKFNIKNRENIASNAKILSKSNTFEKYKRIYE
jgi:hypothetical protein